jgi:phage repressor protein C with HTH and peptisase S24 domain
MDKPFELRRRRLLQLVQTNYGGNQARLAEAISRSYAYVSFLLTDPELPHHKNLGEKLARHIEESARLPKGWLDENPDRPKDSERLLSIVAGSQVKEVDRIGTYNDKDAPPEGYALVKRQTIKIAAGSGTVAYEEERAPPLVFRQAWLDKERLSPDRLAIAYASGDSMQPRIHDGDTMLIDTTHQYLSEGKIYAIRIGDELRVKKIFKRTDSVILHSDNPAYPDEELSAEKAAQLHIIGRVVWISSTL